MNLIKTIKRFFTKTPPIDWFAERKNVHLAWKGSMNHANQIAAAIFSIEGVHEPIIFIEYIDRYCVEIIVNGGNDVDVARMIFEQKPIGVLCLGNTRIDHLFNDIPYKIAFTRPWIFYAVSP